jgi:glycosyltransferase involved in cell wall biosynthesis
MSQPVTVVLLATAWGPRHGGINAFNVEWVRSLGIMPRRRADLVCVVPHADDEDRTDAEKYHVRLVGLGLTTPTLSADAADEVLAALTLPPSRSVIWIGHDDKTGPLAVALRDARPASRVVLVHHMAYRAYQDFKKEDSRRATELKERQRELFRKADLCFAIGPMLQGHLEDLLAGRATRPPVVMLIPGLAEPDPAAIQLSEHSPNNFTAFLGGRLGDEDERIKQALLGVRAFGQAVGAAFSGSDTGNRLCRSPTLRMRGIPDDQHASVRRILQDAGGTVVNSDLAPYTENRVDYFRDLATSSVALMTSWHEGFGLVAWEAIACQVPVVIGEQSGVYRLLHENLISVDRSVRSVLVRGSLPATDRWFFRCLQVLRRSNPFRTTAPHTAKDVRAVRDALIDMGRQLDDCKRDAVRLTGVLRRLRFTWDAAAEQSVIEMERHLGLELRDPPPHIASSPVTGPAGGPGSGHKGPQPPDFLRPPQPRAWHPKLGLAPSALLQARDRVVRFHPDRMRTVDDLLAPVARPEAPLLSLRLLFSPGGMGKTRTALELISQLPADWMGLWLPLELPEAALTKWTQWLATRTSPAILVIDYAEGRQDILLRWLHVALEAAKARADAPLVPSPRLHVLCLARRNEWWEQLSRYPSCSESVAALLSGRANLGPLELPTWSDQEGSRASAYSGALEDYARAQGMKPITNAWTPDLTAPVFARPLNLHLAALAAG